MSRNFFYNHFNKYTSIEFFVIVENIGIEPILYNNRPFLISIYINMGNIGVPTIRNDLLSFIYGGYWSSDCSE